MDGRKFTATLVALAIGIVLSAASVSAQVSIGKPPFQGTAGYLQGDPAPGKLIPYYLASDTVTTIIGIESTIGNDGPFGAELDVPTPINNTFVHIAGGDVSVHFHIFDKFSNEILNFTKCYSPFDFGYLVLQKGPVTSDENADLNFPTGPNATRRNKSQVIQISTAEGYVSIRAERVYATGNGTCGSEAQFTVSADIPDAYDLQPLSPPFNGPLSWPLATWAIVIDISNGFFATEIPTATARVERGSGEVHGGIGAFGLIPKGNEVIARYDANTFNQSISRIFTWFVDNSNSTDGFLDCEDEAEISVFLPFPTEAGFFVLAYPGADPATSTNALKDALHACTDVNQYRGVVRFTMPDTGFIWTHITQQGAHFRENYLGYNLQNNWFIDCADGVLDFGRPFNKFTKGLDCRP